jgi:Holliday junction DNA helicase RuvB
MTDQPARAVSPTQLVDDRENVALRPRSLRDILGQDAVRQKLEISIEAAKGRKEPIEHVLFYGPPGLGKTSFAHIIANEMKVNIKVTSGPSIERSGDLAAILTAIKPNDILFIDEIHRLGRAVEEVLYPAMEDFALDIVIGKGPGAKSMRLRLPRFTVVGATTRLSLLSNPLRDRFGIQFRMDPYDLESLEKIVNRAAAMLNVEIKPEGTTEVARRARGTPRIALRLLRRVRDYAQVRADGIITGRVAGDALNMMEIDHLGLDETDLRILRCIIEKFGGGPVGLETIAAAINEDSATVEDVYEPYLLQLAFIKRTPRGRVAMPSAYEHLGLTPPQILEQPRLI